MLGGTRVLVLLCVARQVVSAGARFSGAVAVWGMLSREHHAAAVCSWSASGCTTSSLQQLDMLGASCRRLLRSAVDCLRLLTPGAQGCRGSRVAPISLTTRSSPPRAVSMLLSWAGAPVKRSCLRSVSLKRHSLCHRRNAQGAVLVSPHATGARFTMYLLNLGALCKSDAACYVGAS